MGIATERLALNQTELARALGVAPLTIRRWEKAGLVRGERNRRGVKLYPIEAARKLAGGK